MKEGTKKSVRKEKMPKKKRNDIKHFLLPPSRVAYWHFGISFAFKWMPALTPSQHWRWIFFSNCVKSIFIISASSFPLLPIFSDRSFRWHLRKVAIFFLSLFDHWISNWAFSLWYEWWCYWCVNGMENFNESFYISPVLFLCSLVHLVTFNNKGT